LICKTCRKSHKIFQEIDESFDKNYFEKAILS
jgi:hypothetical protein